MFHLRRSHWGPFPLPEFLSGQLDERGFSPDDAGRCARLIGAEAPGSEAASSLFVDLGSCKFLEADIDGAIAAWRHAITSGHETPASRSLLNLGLLHEHLHLHERALGLLDRVVELDVSPHVVPAAMASARCQVALEDHERAMETMARLAQRVMATGSEGRELSEALFGLGDIAEHAGRPDRAERAWRAAIAGGVVDIQQASMERLARLLLASGQDYAVFDLLSTDAFVVNSSDPVFLDAAELFRQRGERSLAADVLSLVPGAQCEPGDRFRLADAKMSCGQVNEAIDELEALLAEPDEQIQVRALFSLGQVYAAHDMVEPALSMFERVVAAGDSYWSPTAELALGGLVAASGDAEAATEYWTDAATSDVPGIADQARARLAAQPVAAPDHEVVTLAADAEPENLTASAPAPEPAPFGDMQLISLDSLDANDEIIQIVEPIAIVPSPVMADPVPADPQLISLDLIDTQVGAVRDAEGSAEPVLVVLDSLEPSAEENSSDQNSSDQNSSDLNGSTGGADIDIDTPPTTAGRSTAGLLTSSFASHLEEANPYAALAPDHDSDDVQPTTRNPYAELAPNFDDVEPPPDVEPGDWESMLEDWPRSEPSPEPKKRPSAFSRYT